MRVVVCKTGGSWSVDPTNPKGEQGDAAGVVKILQSLGHDVCMYGAIKGSVPGAHIINWDWNACGMPKDAANANPKTVYAAYDVVLRQLEAWKPDVFIEVTGPCPTLSCVGNPFGVKVFEFAIRYNGIALYSMHQLGLKRVIVSNDPRAIPRDQEMHYMNVVPAALLTQSNFTFTRGVHGTPYRVHGVYAGAENWWSYGWPYRPIGGDEINIIAHAHFDMSKARQSVWSFILSGLEDVDYNIYGDGWSSEWRGWRGVLPPDMVHAAMKRCKCAPCIPIGEGWATGKMRQYLINGALPLPYGVEDDTILRYWTPFECDDIRFETHERLRELIAMDTRDLIEKYRVLTTPKYGLLEEAVKHFGRGGDIQPEKFGGFVKCSRT